MTDINISEAMLMGLFDGLESLGFKEIKEDNIYHNPNPKQGSTAKKAEPVENPLDLLYAKSFTCPVCEKEFINFVARKSKLRLINIETDLKSNYKTINPGQYEVLLCSQCGYAALIAHFTRITEKQSERVLSEIKPRFVLKEFPVPYSPLHAIERYKLALLNAVIKGVKSGEKAIICLKTAWLYRDLKDTANEQLFLRNAYVGLKEAYGTETFPIGNVDEATAQYLIAELARRTGDLPEAMKWISAVVVRRDINKGLKDRAITVKELIRADAKS